MEKGRFALIGSPLEIAVMRTTPPLLRKRSSVLGAVINSQPQYVSSPGGGFTDNFPAGSPGGGSSRA